MKVNFKLLSETASLPAYSREGDACLDIRSDENAVIKAKSFGIVGTGVAVEAPSGFEMQVRARSGLAAKKGIGLVNGIGTIDEDYRGEICVGLINHSKVDFKIQRGDRIAQMAIMEVLKPEILLSDDLSETSRAEGGFGSTGVK